MKMAIYIKNLSELNKDSLPEAGGKGANLGELIRTGLPVPSGFVVTTGAYRAHLEESRLRERIAVRLENLKGQNAAAIMSASNDISSWIEQAPMPVKVREGVSSAFENLSEELRPRTRLLVAVRSSATAEDLPTASFAGQHDTFLGISGEDSVLNHVKKCWVSLWTPEAISYRINMGFEHLKVDLAVVIQVMTASEAAGVMFTANPVNGNRDEILVSAGYGLGETVVGGLINPDSFTLTKEGHIKEKILGSKEKRMMLTEDGTVTEKVSQEMRNAYCIGSGELAQLVNLANIVEKHYGSPQDTEWALSKGKVYLLQARPITTMSASIKEWDTLNSEDKSIYTDNKSPLLLRMGMNWFAEPLTPLDFAYLRKRSMGAVKVVEKENGCVSVKFAELHVFPGIICRFMRMFFQSYFKDAEDLWRTLSKEMNAYLKRMDDSIRDINDAVKLARLVERAIDEFGLLFQRRLGMLSATGPGEGFTLDPSIKKALSKEEAKRLEESLMRALPFKTAVQNKEMIKLARTAVENGKDSKVFKEAFSGFLEEYGDRPSDSITSVLASSTWRENPEFIHGLIDTLLRDGAYLHAEESAQKQEADYEAAKKQVEEMLEQGQVQKFQKSLKTARNEIIIRDESSFYIERLTACIHRIALELGGILAARSVINEAGDVFFLFLEELVPVAEEKLNVKEKIAKRKESFANVCSAHKKGVHWMVSTGSVPAPDKIENEVIKDNVNTFHGVSASRGVYEGSVCIVRDSTEFNKLKKGDVMVCAYTSPAWTPLFKVASAVVTEIGSPTSHAAIVAREYGIPAVAAIPNITNTLKNGRKVRVDGTNGVVTLLNE